MKKIAIALLVFMALYLSGPRVSVDPNINDQFIIPENIDSYLEAQESLFDNITPGAEKKILWYQDQKQQREYAIVYLHGFSASRQEISPVSENLAQKLRANVFFTRLTGHGQGSQALAEAKAKMWLRDTLEAYEIGRKLGKKLIIIAFSTGAPLAMWLAQREMDMAVEQRRIAALALLSANFGPAHKLTNIILLPWGEYILPIVAGKKRTWKARNELQEKYWTTSYPIQALLPMLAVVDMASNFDYQQIMVPAFFLYSETDQIINKQKIKDVYRDYGSNNKELISFPGAEGHIFTGDICQPKNTPQTVELIYRFLNEKAEIR